MFVHKQVTVICSVDLDCQFEQYNTGIAQFQHHVACHCRTERRQCFVPLSFFVAAVGHSVKFFGVANVIDFYY